MKADKNIEKNRFFHVLADQENIHGAQIELVEERESREALFRWVHAGIELSQISKC